MLKKKSILYGIIFCLFFFSSPLLHADDFDPQWSIKGFGSIGTTGTDTNTLGFRRDTSQTQEAGKSWGIATDSRLGVQLDVDFNESFHITAQWIARDHAGDFIEQNLEWAFLRWSPMSDLNIRAGRLGADVYLLSDYRNVGYAYPWIRPPHEFYGGIPLYHFDGFDISKRFRINNDYLTLKFFTGYTHNQLSSNPSNEVFDFDAGVIGANIVYETENWRARASYAYLHVNKELPDFEDTSELLKGDALNFGLPNVRALIPSLKLKNSSMHFASIGGSYDDGIWLAHAEGSYFDSETPLQPSQISGYFSLGRRFSTLTLYSLFGMSHTLQNKIDIPEPVIPDAQLQALHDGLDIALNKNGVDQKSVSVGLRWDFYSNVALKAQWSHFWIGDNGSQLWRESTTGQNNDVDTVNVWSVGLDFIF